jgi:hypothetical protein
MICDVKSRIGGCFAARARHEETSGDVREILPLIATFGDEELGSSSHNGAMRVAGTLREGSRP